MFVRTLIIAALVLLVLWTLSVRSSDASRPETTYVVRPYDTLWSIASSHYAGDPREAVELIRERNALRGTVIHPGQRLALPGG